LTFLEHLPNLHRRVFVPFTPSIGQLDFKRWYAKYRRIEWDPKPEKKICCFRKHGEKIGSVVRIFESLTIVLNHANE